MTLDENALVLCAGTLEHTPLLERLAPSRDAGFDGISVFTTDVIAAREAGVEISELRKRIEGEGLEVGEFDPVAKWLPNAIDAGGLLAMDVDDALRSAEAIGARSITAIVFTTSPPSRDELVEHFSRFCDRGAEAGLQIHIEFMPFGAVASLAHAVDLVKAADRENAGIMFDAWHWFRSGGTLAEIEAAAPWIRGVQLDDAPAVPAENIMLETTTSRLLPGEGDADVPAVLRALREGGSRAPLGVEVFSQQLIDLPAAEAARRAHDAVRSCLEKSR